LIVVYFFIVVRVNGFAVVVVVANYTAFVIASPGASGEAESIVE